MKQVKINSLVVYEGRDDAACEYAAGVIRQAGEDALELAGAVARGERDLVAIDADTFVTVEDSPGKDLSTWTLAPTGVWQSSLLSLEMIAEAIRQYDAEDLAPADFVEAVREQIGDDPRPGPRAGAEASAR
jgi:hypothetical protein